MRRQRINALIAGAWFLAPPSPSPAPSNASFGTFRKSVSNPYRQSSWRFYRLDVNERHLHYLTSDFPYVVAEGLEDMTSTSESFRLFHYRRESSSDLLPFQSISKHARPSFLTPRALVHHQNLFEPPSAISAPTHSSRVTPPVVNNPQRASIPSARANRSPPQHRRRIPPLSTPRARQVLEMTRRHELGTSRSVSTRTTHCSSK